MYQEIYKTYTCIDYYTNDNSQKALIEFFFCVCCIIQIVSEENGSHTLPPTPPQRNKPKVKIQTPKRGFGGFFMYGTKIHNFSLIQFVKLVFFISPKYLKFSYSLFNDFDILLVKYQEARKI